MSLGLSLCWQMLVAGPSSVRLGPVTACLGFLLARSSVHLLRKTKLDDLRVFPTKEKRNKYATVTLKDGFCLLTLRHP